jgi:hypothetical protein
VNRLTTAVLAAALALSGAVAAADGDAKFALRLPQQEHVSFRGVSSLDGAGGGTASILYPAPNAAGLIAAVITHGVLSGASRTSEKERIQEAADRVLLPYQGVLKSFDHRELMQRGLRRARLSGEKRLIEPAQPAAGETVIESLPVFSMTQDQSAIILDNAIVLYAPGASQEPTYKNAIRVVARAKEAGDFAAFWTAERGEALKDESARLFAASVELAFSDAAKQLAGSGAAQRTVRYQEGNSEKMERGEILSEGCSRLVIRTLRQTLMSVPLKRADAMQDPICASAVLD